jgi:hypothetical protein
MAQKRGKLGTCSHRSGLADYGKLSPFLKGRQNRRPAVFGDKFSAQVQVDEIF